MRVVKNKAVKLARNHLVTTLATLAALMLFVGLGRQLFASTASGISQASLLPVAFLLNVAIILFGWTRARELQRALESLEAADMAAQRNASCDHTTGLANRGEFIRRLAEALEGPAPGVLLMLDLDHFKRINDLHGHAAGDRLLVVVGKLLTATAPQDACCARIGGDEFAILLPACSEDEGDALAEQLMAKLCSPLSIGHVQAQVGASIGLARLERGIDEEAALRRSDVALYAAKNAGRNCRAWFSRDLEGELLARLKLEEDIRDGIAAGEFIPYFQPLIDLESRDLAGFEVLARWKSKTRGLVEPDDFLTAAETTGLIGPLTLSVMEQALCHARSWPANLKIAVNISASQFRDPSLAQQIVKVLTLTGFPASRLELEITEAALLENQAQVTTIIKSLKALGVSISLDDFGTGYASLAQLDLLPVDRIKIDRSFISNFVKSERTAAIVNTIATMGRRLNVPITAEGVETEWARNELSSLGCTQAQGWLFGRAVSAETLRDFLELGSSDGGEPGLAPVAPRRRTGNEG